MSFFFPESRIESLLEQEARVVPGPGKAAVSINSFKVLWKAYDFLIFFGIHSPESLSDLAIRNAELLGISFEESFAAVICNANDQARTILGIDCFTILPAPST